MTHSEIEKLISILDLKPHPEGGFFKETYRSRENHKPPESLRIEGDRSISTAIYFMLRKGNFSAFHRIKQDEVWHHYLGGTIVIHSISPEGKYRKFGLGKNLEEGEKPQHVVPGGYWFASETLDEYALAGCTVAPGFDFADFEMAERGELILAFPEHEREILRLTR